MEPWVYLNGKYLPASQANVSIFDRGLLFGDAVYEVLPIYQGVPYFVDRHLARFASSLEKIRLTAPKLDWKHIINELCRLNGGGDMQVYMQITRGNQGVRKHDIPKDLEATVFAFTLHTPYTSDDDKRRGLKAHIAEDYRWQRCDIKACTLLANVLLNDDALAHGAETTLLSRAGYLTEGSASNVFLVDTEGLIKTPPLSELCLPGITRAVVIELIKDLQLPFRETIIPIEEVFLAKELMITSTTKELYPITQVDQKVVGQGLAGPYWEQLNAAFHQRIAAHHDR